MFEKFKESMMAEFEMSDLGMMHYFLGIEVVQLPAGIFISQKKYVQEILDRFQMKNCNSVSTPTKFGLKLTKDHDGKKVDSTLYKQIVGSLMYLTATRPDIMFSVSLISRYMENPTELHLLAAKRIFRYLQDLRGFTDSDYAGDQDDRRSTSGYVFMLGSGAVSWLSKKQPIVTLSTTEAEFVSATSCVRQAIRLKKILEELYFKRQCALQFSVTIALQSNSPRIQFYMEEASILTYYDQTPQVGHVREAAELTRCLFNGESNLTEGAARLLHNKQAERDDKLPEGLGR
ncbi:uncharacterized mitochondrial protein AtMg00810-like [Rhododendron vialii]|uniref:uncharacterized mitochondrial protein AtMg00810-like n=1 Tax=Rhododendron vialii TaxID=182163 RepID=UPI00265FEA6F|nr:uncharacterized mitochondrial protein AtMg00810-like [Rhododendron vialii]